MIIDNNGKLFGKISIVDILIVAVLLAAIGGVYYKFGRSKTVSPFSKPDTIEVSFYVEDIPAFVANSIKEGDLAKDRVNNITIGKITSAVVGPDIFFYPNSEGQAIASSKPGYASIQFTVRGQGVYSDTGSSISGMEYYVNKQFELRVGAVNTYPRVMSIKKVKE